MDSVESFVVDYSDTQRLAAEVVDNDRGVEVVAEVAGVVPGREAAVEIVGGGYAAREVAGARALDLLRDW